jgi:hypothetical protein
MHGPYAVLLLCKGFFPVSYSELWLHHAAVCKDCLIVGPRRVQDVRLSFHCHRRLQPGVFAKMVALTPFKTLVNGAVMHGHYAAAPWSSGQAFQLSTAVLLPTLCGCCQEQPLNQLLRMACVVVM